MTREPALAAEQLDAETLARRTALPLKVAPVTLTGRRVRLEPLEPDRDAAALHAVSNGAPARLGEREVGEYDAEALVWRYMPVGPFADVDAFRAYLQGLADSPNSLAFRVVDVPTGQPVGVVTMMSNMPEHLKIELGNIWFSPLVQRTLANTEATYLMLRHAFELGYRRVEWKCDALNARSRRAAERNGFVFEGIQDAHFIVKGRNRDTAWFRMLDREWPDARRQLEAALAAE